MVRVPDDGRIEFRLPDGAANPYLMMAGILAAGMHGIDDKMDPGKRLDIDMYAEGHTVKDARKLPLNLLDALRNFENDKYLRDALGDGSDRRLPQAQAQRVESAIAATSRSGSARPRSIADDELWDEFEVYRSSSPRKRGSDGDSKLARTIKAREFSNASSLSDRPIGSPLACHLRGDDD